MAIINVYTNIIFTWDDKKATHNLDKRDVDFKEACSIFSDPKGLHFDDFKHSKNEIRYQRLAKSRAGRILLVVFTVGKLKNGKETICIISARQSSKKEREAYLRF